MPVVASMVEVPLAEIVETRDLVAGPATSERAHRFQIALLWLVAGAELEVMRGQQEALEET